MKYIVTFTTSPKRIRECKPMLDSILYQTRKADMVVLNIPDIFERTGETYNVPESIANNITVNYCGHDWGPATKLVPTVQLLRERGFDPDNTRILYLDDDIRYQPEMIECLESVETEDCVWCGRGVDYVNFNQKGRRHHRLPASIAEAYSSVCVKLSVFKEDFMKYMDIYTRNPITRFSDDVIFSNYFHRVGIPIRAFCIPGRFSYMDLDRSGRLMYGHQSDALWKGADGLFENHTKQYFKVIEELSKSNQRYFKLYFVDEDKNIDITI